MLLKNSMLSWSKRVRTARPERVPVLIDLHRCNGGADSLLDLIVAELARSGIDQTERNQRVRELASQALRQGTLSLLLDGLDEVGRADQERVFAEIRDFARQYRGCQFVVTCRDVVYQGQPLGQKFAHVVRVAEFDDAAIIRFLGNWRGLAGAPAAEIFTSLRKNPTLMRLARSPLLLTMIAYLHTEVFSKSGKRLPTSRPAFYQEAITHLLGRDVDLGRAKSLTVYEVGEKLAVLQRVALTSMEAADSAVDRLTISRRRLESTTKGLLPDLNLDHTHIKELLEEIIDRSQLLVAVDKRRSHYVFRHLTLQEYLAAMELADDPDGLLDRYRADPLAWRETVKLWCGASARDSTRVIADIFNSPEPHHKILALECLAEAKRVDHEFAQSIVAHFLLRLGSALPDLPAVIAALGAVAADSRPRGQEVLKQLTDFATSDSPAKADAMQALSASGTLAAAEVLASRGGDDEDIRAALRGMGELALPALAARAAEGMLWAVDDLAVVGTPAAAEHLVALLARNDEVAVRAAWRLAVLIGDASIEEHLRRSRAPIPAQPEVWFWRPFAADEDDSMLFIAGRIVALLLSPAVDIAPDTVRIDVRLGIPLVLSALRKVHLHEGTWTKEIKKELSFTAVSSLNAQLDRFFSEKAHIPDGPDAKAESMCGLVDRACNLSYREWRLLGLLDWPVRAIVYAAVLSHPRDSAAGRIRSDDWLTVRTPQRETRFLSRMFNWGLGTFTFALFATGIVRAILSLTNAWPYGPDLMHFFALSGLVVTVAAIFGDRDSLFTIFYSITAVGVLAWLGIVSAISLLSWPFLAAIGGVLAISGACGLLARRRNRINSNPFRRCLDASSIHLGDRKSVIAA